MEFIAAMKWAFRVIGLKRLLILYLIAGLLSVSYAAKRMEEYHQVSEPEAICTVVNEVR